MKNKIFVIGHRGAAGHAPENTRAAFEAGRRLGADAVECDVRLTRDRQLLVIHDDRLDRTTDGHGPVAAKTWRELRSLDAGRWFGRRFEGERLWRLQDLLAWAKRQRTRRGDPLQVVVEIKSSSRLALATARRVAAVLQRARMVRRVWVISFYFSSVEEAKKRCPGLRGGLLFSRRSDDPLLSRRRSGAAGLFPKASLVTDAWGRKARARGWFVATWTVNLLRDIQRLSALGVDAITSDFPERVLRARR